MNRNASIIVFLVLCTLAFSGCTIPNSNDVFDDTTSIPQSTQNGPVSEPASAASVPVDPDSGGLCPQPPSCDPQKPECKPSTGAKCDPYSEDNCGQGKGCPVTTVSCISDSCWSKDFDKAIAGMCDQANCKLLLKKSACKAAGLTNGQTINPQTEIETLKDKLDSALTPTQLQSVCTAIHEATHAGDSGADCPACGSEIKGYEADNSCAQDYINTHCASPVSSSQADTCALAANIVSDSTKRKNFQQCLCDHLAPGESQKYTVGTCDACVDNLLGLSIGDTSADSQAYCWPYEEQTANTGQ